MSAPELDLALNGRIEELRIRFDPKRKITLVQSPQFLFEAINLEVIRRKGYYAFPPTGLQWVAKVLRNRGFSIDILDLNFLLLRKIIDEPDFDHRDWLSLLDDHLDRVQPSIVGVTCLTVFSELFDTTHHPLTEIFRHLRARDEHLVIGGGPTISNAIFEYLERDLCDFVVEGEGEDRMAYIMDLLFDKPAAPVSGVHFKYQGQTHVSLGPAAAFEPEGNLIDTYPEVPIEDYTSIGCLNPFSRMMGQDTPFGVFQLNRGCRYDCKFCGVRSFMGKGIRTSRVDEVLSEIEYLAADRGIRHFDVLDDDFLARKEDTLALLGGMTELRSQYPFTWSASNGLVGGALTNDVLELMRSSGCMGFRIGIESGDPEMLRRMRKPGSVPLFEDVGRRLGDYPEFFVGGNYIVGLFGEETWGQMLNTLGLACRVDLDWASFTVFQFTSTAVVEKERFDTKGQSATDFVPVKDSSDYAIEDTPLIGPGIFEAFAFGEIPPRSALKHIWFTFNLLANYINNKAFKPGGHPDKYARWVEALQINYPTNPYIALFEGLARTLLGEHKRAQHCHARTRQLLNDSKLWKYRFQRFGLIELADRPPERDTDVYERLHHVRASYAKYLPAPARTFKRPKRPQIAPVRPAIAEK